MVQKPKKMEAAEVRPQLWAESPPEIPSPSPTECSSGVIGPISPTISARDNI